MQNNHVESLDNGEEDGQRKDSDKDRARLSVSVLETENSPGS